VWQKYFLTSKIQHKEENKLPPNSKLQETDHWFHFDSVRDVSHVLTVEIKVCVSVIRLPNFFVNESLLYFGHCKNSIALFVGKIRLQSPIKQVVFSYCSRIWNPQSLSQQQSKHSATPSAQDIFLPLFLTIMGINWVASLSTFDFSSKTSHFIYVKRVSRDLRLNLIAVPGLSNDLSSHTAKTRL